MREKPYLDFPDIFAPHTYNRNKEQEREREQKKNPSVSSSFLFPFSPDYLIIQPPLSQTVVSSLSLSFSTDHFGGRRLEGPKLHEGREGESGLCELARRGALQKLAPKEEEEEEGRGGARPLRALFQPGDPDRRRRRR